MFDLTIVGAGAIGLATAYKYQLKHPQARVLILEKEKDIATHQTGRNSGVIHSGIYYKPGSFKALNCADGRRQLVNFAKEFNVPHDVCGKVIVAANVHEIPLLDKIYNRGRDNATPGIEKINAKEIKEIEPFVEGVEGIRVPVTGIIDFKALCRALWQQIKTINAHSELRTGVAVKGSFSEDGKHGVITNKGPIESKYTIFCGGLQADRLAKAEVPDLQTQIVGFRGDYYELTESGKHKVKNLIYPVPSPEFPFLGVHFTRMTDGSIECGPNAVFSFAREGYSRTAFNLKDSLQALQFSGTWKLFQKHYKQGIKEYKRAFSKKLFLQELQRLIPSLTMQDIEPARSGVRAQALWKNGELVDDFEIVYGQSSIHVINAPSPAATSCLSIADRIVEMIKDAQST